MGSNPAALLVDFTEKLSRVVSGFEKVFERRKLNINVGESKMMRRHLRETGTMKSMNEEEL